MNANKEPLSPVFHEPAAQKAGKEKTGSAQSRSFNAVVEPIRTKALGMGVRATAGAMQRKNGAVATGVTNSNPVKFENNTQVGMHVTTGILSSTGNVADLSDVMTREAVAKSAAHYGWMKDKAKFNSANSSWMAGSSVNHDDHYFDAMNHSFVQGYKASDDQTKGGWATAQIDLFGDLTDGGKVKAIPNSGYEILRDILVDKSGDTIKLRVTQNKVASAATVGIYTSKKGPSATCKLAFDFDTEIPVEPEGGGDMDILGAFGIDIGEGGFESEDESSGDEE